MRIFVTGGTGALGRALIRALRVQGHCIAALTRSPSADIEGAQPVTGDLLVPGGYASALAGCDAVYHLAAVTHATDPDRYYAVNAHGTELLLEAVRRAGVTRFLFVSTRAVGAACGPYGDSKALAEAAVQASDLDWTILRPSEVYGASGNEAVWRLIEDIRVKPLVPVVSDPRASLSPVHCDDVVQALARALDCPASIGATYVLAGPQTLTYSQFARAVARACNTRPIQLPVPAFALSMAACVFKRLGLKRPPFVPDQVQRLLCAKQADSSAAVRDLGYAPRSLFAGLAPKA